MAIIKRTHPFLAGTYWMMGVICVAAHSESLPRIQFAQTNYDFGTTSQSTVSGVFKFKNDGGGVLKMEPPKASCGGTFAELKPGTLQPGQCGELLFTLNLGIYRTTLEKRIAVQSNDPQTPEVWLTIKVNYAPLYDLEPLILSPALSSEVTATIQFATVTRTDGKPHGIVKLETSKPWITAMVEPSAQGDEAVARLRVAIQRDGPPRRFIEYVDIYNAEQTITPVTSLYLYGHVIGEIALDPEALHWSTTVASSTENSEAMIPRRVTIRSTTGQDLAIRNPQSTIQGLRVELVPKEGGKVYELIARLDKAPASTVTGNVSFETSGVPPSRIEVPATVYVFKP